MKTKQCESCLMPFDQDTGVREDERYCSLCYRDGKFCYEGDRKGFQKICLDAMQANGIPAWKARFFAWMIRFAPRWRGQA